jgi:hypothetical protein
MGQPGVPPKVQGPADYKSAIQQIANLRYVTVFVGCETKFFI